MPNLSKNVHYLVCAFLCPDNRAKTMLEHKCDEIGLFENPEYLLHRHFKNRGMLIDVDDRREMEFFLSTRNGRQIIDAFLCPVNRHCTRVENNYSDADLIKDRNFEKLIMHYVINGGAEAFAKKRESFLPDSPNCK